MAYQKITETDRYLFGKGTHYEIYEKLGAHPAVSGKRHGVSFAVWAPHAASVSVIGDFNGWDPNEAPMEPLADSGIWETFVPGAKKGDLYKFYITDETGKGFAKADPYAFYSELRPGTASRIFDLSGFSWQDQEWMTKRPRKKPVTEPYAIYEVHPGSWKKHDGEGDSAFYSYRELAESLSGYVKKMGYTHVELIGIAEYPFDGSWGYQVTGYYAPTSRYGTPSDFMYFVDYLHRQGIGVILDWVPAHFPRDAHGLADFDGQALYEYADPRKGEHPDWGTKIFDYSRTEVSNFLIANALYWLEKFHIDGLRVDAVASMLYLDYGKKEGQWIPNQYGENKNLEAIEFFRHLNSIIKVRVPGAITIAEESTAWPGVTADPSKGGLGFTFKWNMGWMHDFLSYMKEDPLFRKYHHNQMTFGLTYASSENFILVLSHDEVVHLKCSMLEKMPGTGEDKFANLKVGYTFMIGHPGKKLLFMGQEFGQKREWSEERELDWFLLEDPDHKNLQKFFHDLLHLYRTHPALYRKDQDGDGFQWINCDDAERSIFSFARFSPTGKKNLLFLCNFTPVERKDYRAGVPCPGDYTLLLDQSAGLYGRGMKKPVQHAVRSECDGKEFSIAHPLAPYGVAVYEFAAKTDAKKKK
jgi:1,4-alpha-glucan branching enzyme